MADAPGRGASPRAESRPDRPGPDGGHDTRAPRSRAPSRQHPRRSDRFVGRCRRMSVRRPCPPRPGDRARRPRLGAPWPGWPRRRRRRAHGPAPDEPPTAASLLLGWTFEPLPDAGDRWSSAGLVELGRSPGRSRPIPANPVPRRRSVRVRRWAWRPSRSRCCPGSTRYDTTLFSVHMVQHVLLAMVAAPLLALAAPITLILRVSSHETRDGAGSCPSSTRGSCASSRSRWSPGSSSPRSCG